MKKNMQTNSSKGGAPVTNWDIIVVNNIYCEIICKTVPTNNGIVQNEKLTTVLPLIQYLSSIQQKGTTITIDDLFAIKIISQSNIGFVPNQNTPNNLPQLFLWANIDVSIVNALANDIISNL